MISSADIGHFGAPIAVIFCFKNWQNTDIGEF